MTASYSPTLCAELVAEMRDDDAKATPGPWSVDPLHYDDRGKQMFFPSLRLRGAPTEFNGHITINEPSSTMAEHNATASAIARTRNRLATVAEQLEAASIEIATYAGYDKVLADDGLRTGALIEALTNEHDAAIAERDALRAEVEKLRNLAVVVTDGHWDDVMAERDELRAEVERLRAHTSCPCLLTTPCQDQCTCAHPLMSTGCLRCCSYGSLEQRTAKAERLAAVDALRADNERMRAVFEAAVEWSESFGELSKRLPPHVHKLRDAVDAALAERKEKP